jgi:uncharacterized protein (TIGR00730 family)
MGPGKGLKESIRRMKVTIFGGATPQNNGTSYEDAFRLGQCLAQAGHTVLTGGYIGTMEAASRGAAEAGGHVIGVTCEEVETWRKVKPNAWVLEEWRFPSLHERLLALIDGCDAAIALPGGVGTLLEIAMMWNRMVIDAIPHQPLILVGEGWREIMTAFYTAQGGFVSESARQLIFYAKDVDEAFIFLQEHQKAG